MDKNYYANKEQFINMSNILEKSFFESTKKKRVILRNLKKIKTAIPLQIFYSQKGKKVILYGGYIHFIAKKETQHQIYFTGLVGTIEEKLEMVYCMHKK